MAKGVLAMLVVVADDHALFRDGLRLQLQELDAAIEVLDAGDFNQALTITSQHSGSVDLLLLDLDMPGMDWRQALEELGNQAEALSIVVISATGDPAVIEEALAKGVSGIHSERLQR